MLAREKEREREREHEKQKARIIFMQGKKTNLHDVLVVELFVPYDAST